MRFPLQPDMSDDYATSESAALDCRRAQNEAARRWNEWAATPDGKAALDRGWALQKVRMWCRGLVTGPD